MLICPGCELRYSREEYGLLSPCCRLEGEPEEELVEKPVNEEETEIGGGS